MTGCQFSYFKIMIHWLQDTKKLQASATGIQRSCKLRATRGKHLNMSRFNKRENFLILKLFPCGLPLVACIYKKSPDKKSGL
jgi:hypothetical protein